MRLETTVDIAAPPEAVWAFVSDPARVLHFMSGVTRWEVVSDEPTGCGARYRTLMRVGSAEVGSLIEVVEFAENSELAWTSLTGIDQRARWRLRARGLDGEHPTPTSPSASPTAWPALVSRAGSPSASARRRSARTCGGR